MIGDKLLQEPTTNQETVMVHHEFEMRVFNTPYDTILFNAKRLVEMNNELYERLNPDGEDILKQRMTPEIEDKVDKLIERLDRLIEVNTNK